MAMNLESSKIELIQWLLTLEDESIVQQLLELRANATRDWWEKASAEEQRSILAGIKEAEAGLVKPHTEARELYAKWL
jgi:predicted transcriptional regulator